MEGDLIWGDEHTIQYKDGVLWNFTPKAYVILLTNVIPINSIKKILKRSRPPDYRRELMLVPPPPRTVISKL